MRLLAVFSVAVLAGCSSQPIAAGVWIQFENPQDSRAFQVNFTGRDERFTLTDRSRWEKP